MRAAPRAEDAEVASLVERFRAKGEEESRRRDAFDREWDQRIASFRKRSDAVEGKLRERHASALEKTRASLEARLVSKPKRYTPQLEELLRKRKELMRRRQFSEALDALKQSEAREKLELEDHKRRVRGENVELLDALFQRQRDELAVFARERDAEETRINAARADAAARAAKRGFRDYEPRRVAGEERLPGSDDGDEADEVDDDEADANEVDGDGDARAVAGEARRRVSRVPSIRQRDARADVERVAEALDAETEKARVAASAASSPPRVAADPELASAASAPASPAALARFYSDVGGAADVMRLDTADTARKRTGRAESLPACPAASLDPGVRTRFPSVAARVPTATPVAPYAGACALDPRVDDAAYGFMVSDAQRAELAELRARRDAALRAWEAEERRLVLRSSRGDATASRGTAVDASSAAVRVEVPGTIPAPAIPGMRLGRLETKKSASSAPRRAAAKPTENPTPGLTGAEARAAADDLVAAAMRMTRADASRAAPPESTAKRRARGEAAAAAEARAARRRELKDDGGGGGRGPMGGGTFADDSDDSVCSEELDDLYLATPPGRAPGAREASEGVGLELGALAGAFKSEPGPLAPRGGGVAVGGPGTSAAPRRLRISLPAGAMTHRRTEKSGDEDSLGVFSASRGPAAPRVAEDAADPRRDFPAGPVARGAALLRRMPGPDDCYRNRRLGPPELADAGAGELGFPRRDDRIVASARDEEAASTGPGETGPDAPSFVGDEKKGEQETAATSRFESRRTPFSRAHTPPSRAEARDGDGPELSREDAARAEKTETAAEERDRRQSAAVAAARAAAFKYGATVAPAVGAFGQPIPVPNRTDAAARVAPRSPPRRRAAPLGHNVDPVTFLKLSDAQLARAVERDGLRRGEVLVSVDANANANEPSSAAGSVAVSFRDPTALPEPPTVKDVALLFRHCRKGEYELCRDLFKRRAIDPNARDAHGNTPLIAACQSGAGRVAKLCLRRGADVNAVNGKKNSALHYAATFGFDALARWLVDNGADTHAVNDTGKKPFEGL